MDFEKDKINGLLTITPDIYRDDRGYFYEQYNRRKYHDAGLAFDFVQDNTSFSLKNTLRGLHYQVNQIQGKLVQVLEGEVFDVAVDIRKDSRTFGQWSSKILSYRDKLQFFIPPGFAHGFYVLSETALLLYKCTDYYSPKDERGIIWNDPDISIEWPLTEKEPKLSDKDILLPKFKNINFLEKIV